MLQRSFNNLNLTFSSEGECVNATSGCYGNGACTLHGSDWYCLCKLMRDYRTNCRTTAQETVWEGNDTYFWVFGLSFCSLMLVCFAVEMILQFKHKKVVFNELTITRSVLLLCTALRIVDYAFWGRSEFEQGVCLLCSSVALFFTFFPYILFVLSLKLCVVTWYNLVLNLSLKSENYKLGKNIYVGISIFYTIGAVVLIVFMCISLELFMNFVIYWIIIPPVGTIIHCYVQVFKLNRQLHDKSDYSTRVAWKKNIILGLLSLDATILILITIGMSTYQLGMQVNWWSWLIFYSLLRLFECFGILLLFMFCEQYTFALFCDTKTNSSDITTTKRSTTSTQ